MINKFRKMMCGNNPERIEAFNYIVIPGAIFWMVLIPIIIYCVCNYS